MNFKPIKNELFESNDGPSYIYLYNKDSISKNDLIKIEELPLGRFVDIDLYTNNIKSVSRDVLRKCYLCDSPAFLCIRNKTHKVEDLNEYIKERILEETSKKIEELIRFSTTKELNLNPKFGLVTLSSRGSHKDMDYSLMRKSIEVVIPYLTRMYKQGFKCEDIKKSFIISREYGKIAEKKMLDATQGVNTYKGLIFDLGLVLIALGYKLSHYNSKESIFDYIRIMTKDITKEIKTKDTFGKKAYIEEKIIGARGEAETGFKVVEELLSLKFDLDSDKGLYESLRYLIVNSSDTVLYKRSGSNDNYLKIKEMFNNAVLTKEKIIELTDYSIKNNLSFGGSADLLILTIFIEKINSIYF